MTTDFGVYGPILCIQDQSALPLIRGHITRCVTDFEHTQLIGVHTPAGQKSRRLSHAPPAKA